MQHLIQHTIFMCHHCDLISIGANSNRVCTNNTLIGVVWVQDVGHRIRSSSSGEMKFHPSLYFSDVHPVLSDDTILTVWRWWGPVKEDGVWAECSDCEILWSTAGS